MAALLMITGCSLCVLNIVTSIAIQPIVGRLAACDGRDTPTLVLERLHSCCPTSTHLDWGMVQRDERRHGEQCHAHDEALSGSFVVPGAAPEPSFRAKGQLRTSQCMRASSAPTRPLPHETLPHAALVLFTHSQGLLTISNKAANLGSAHATRPPPSAQHLNSTFSYKCNSLDTVMHSNGVKTHPHA